MFHVFKERQERDKKMTVCKTRKIWEKVIRILRNQTMSNSNFKTLYIT